MARPSRWNDVVAASGKIFREKGYHAATLDDIAKELGIWKGSIYHYIESKEDLLLAVVSEPATHLLSETRELVGTELPAEEKLRRLTRLHVGILKDYEPFAQVYVQEIAGRGSAEWADKDREYVALVESIISELLTPPAAHVTAEPRILALVYLGALNWMVRWYRPGGPMPPHEIADQITQLFLLGFDGLVSPKPSKERIAT